MKLTLGLALFTFAAMPFVFGGYQLGRLHGIEEAKRIVDVEREYHDNFRSNAKRGPRNDQKRNHILA